MSLLTVPKTKKISRKPLLIPRSLDLALLFDKFIQYWAGKAEVEFVDQALDRPLNEILEVCVRWKGSVTGTLVIRCYSEFLKWLVANRGPNPPHELNDNQSFKEMGSLYCVYLIQNYWLSSIFELGLVLPHFSTVQDLPQGPSNSTCRLRVEKNPVEIRLWID